MYLRLGTPRCEEFYDEKRYMEYFAQLADKFTPFYAIFTSLYQKFTNSKHFTKSSWIVGDSGLSQSMMRSNRQLVKRDPVFFREACAAPCFLQSLCLCDQ